MLGFFIGCTVSNDDPSSPGGTQAVVGTWVEIDPGYTKEDITFTENTFVDTMYYWNGSTWVYNVGLRGSFTTSGDLLSMTAREISYDGSNWGAYGPVSMSWTYSITDNVMTIKIGGDVSGVYTKQ